MVKITIGWGGELEGAEADVVQGLVVDHEADVGVLEQAVRGEDAVVRLDDGGGDLGRGVDGESELGFLTVIDGESLEEERSETGSGTTTDGLEGEETLETSALIGKLSDSVEAEIDDFLTNGVMSSGEVVGSIFFT